MQSCIKVENYELTEAEVKYLKVIFKEKEKGKKINLSLLSKYLNIKPSSAHEIIKKLEEKNLINKKWGSLELTEEGINLMENVILRSRILENFFYFILKMDERKASIEANKIDYLVSCELVIKIAELLDKEGYRSNHCIHGKPLYYHKIKDIIEESKRNV